VKPSEELLALRERLAGLGERAAKLALAKALYDWPQHGGVSWQVYDAIQAERIGAGVWARLPNTTHLEVVEMLERAAVAAMKDEA
jgi:hypothetical protein